MWDLSIPQEAASILYEDNDGATAMANAGKPTPAHVTLISNFTPFRNG